MTSIADIVRRHRAEYTARFGGRMPPSHLRALDDIAACGTPSMGGFRRRVVQKAGQTT